jgi:hypothetical protein
MSILTAKRTWNRRPPPKRRLLRVLTPTQSANVRRVLRFLAVEHGSGNKLASALGMTPRALERARVPSRRISVELTFITARIAGVGVDDVLAGRWERHVCPSCGHVGAHPRAK